MSKRGFAAIVVVFCVFVLFLCVVVTSAGVLVYRRGRGEVEAGGGITLAPTDRATVEGVPTHIPPAEKEETRPTLQASVVSELPHLAALYERLSPGVVNIQVLAVRDGAAGQGAGSGFILDDKGHIVTNNHVVAGAVRVTVLFYNGLEVEAEVVGTDPDSDLAVIRVSSLAQGTHPLPLGDSDQVAAGEWVVAIGNPFGLGGSMTLGIVSAVGRMIPSGATPFNIPQAIQTDAAINPGNSGGPLLNLKGEVIGVNAQIASGGGQANAGVGFAIPANVVGRVAPALIERGSFEWPWLGIQGGDVNLRVMEANGLDSQQGGYVHYVDPDGPAAEAGLEGSSETREVDGFDMPVGGDVVVAVDGQSIADFSDLLAQVAARDVGDEIELTVLRDGRRRRIAVVLVPRRTDSSPDE